MENEKKSWQQDEEIMVSFEDDPPTDEIEPENETALVEENFQEAYIEEVSEKKFNWMKEIREWIVAIVLAVVITFGIKYFIFDIVQVEGTSMLPTVVDSDRIVLLKLGYMPKQFDVIVLETPTDPGRPYIKRVIATEGQIVDIKGGHVYVDGTILEEVYLPEGLATSPNNTLTFPLTVAEETVFVLGDNRGVSKDSRSIGLIPVKDVLGKAVYRFWPFSSMGSVK